MSHWLQIVVATPAHSAIAGPLTYRSALLLRPGTLVRVPFGRREVLGVVWQVLPDSGGMPEASIRDIAGVLDGLAPLSSTWRRLVAFTAGYYQRSLGEVALAALPPQLRDLTTLQLTRRLKRTVVDTSHPQDTTDLIALSAQQACAIAEFDAETSEKQRPALLFGATGSGKTEVYLRAAAKVLEQDPEAQVLVMVPEINLTPQLQARFEARFAHLGRERVVPMHSGLTPAQRLKGWLAAHSGQARLVLGTRMAVFASMPNLRLLVVDEEHDPSYKQQEGARYSARDLAVYRARLETRDREHPHGACRVLLGSATPSLESWQATIVGRYQRLNMNERIGASPAGQPGGLPTVRRVDMNHQPKHCVIAPPLLAAIGERVARGEQSMIFLNRRGYAPVLACHDCDWKSDCPHCSAYRVFHKIDRTLRCHHCGFTERVPRACPSCGNIDIAPVGRGTERLEEHLAELLANVTRPDGGPVRIARIDADSTRLKGSLESQLASVHAGEVDVLVGTQMIAKGHDFRHITLVAAINTDSALFSSDFRAPERLFSLLMQAAGRAGRDAQRSAASEMWVQTFHPDHPLFEALKRHDYPDFAEQQLAERQAAGLSPFGFSALIRADAKTQEVAQGFLNAAAEAAQTQQLPGHAHVMAYPAVPMTIQRVANIERAQMLVESPSRKALQGFLAAWQPLLFETRRQAEFKSLVRWAIDVDPIAI
ncbi:replication restart helicase PriA [Polaromonas naphthalenivorans]|uniref:Replication restart protein PriA n=1 Tax=Polaromonas naphthalenivorans (strain CJ2) TaxID=365044 RepID=A1VJ57_POLNA|nr:primosomal protein N' [Polaromonas naphthalenivorans]ABM35685.1 primosomal protein N' [Polaromonas naphthalenivorans CJ2]